MQAHVQKRKEEEYLGRVIHRLQQTGVAVAIEFVLLHQASSIQFQFQVSIAMCPVPNIQLLNMLRSQCCTKNA